jgi:hypothetical protein
VGAAFLSKGTSNTINGLRGITKVSNKQIKIKTVNSYNSEII